MSPRPDSCAYAATGVVDKATPVGITAPPTRANAARIRAVVVVLFAVIRVKVIIIYPL